MSGMWISRGMSLAVMLVALSGEKAGVAGQIPDSLPPGAVDTLAVGEPSAALDSLDAASPDSLLIQPLPEEVIMHMSHLLTTFSDTPGGMGLIETGIAEAGIAAEYVRIAGQDSLNLRNMTSNMIHVIHAIDPSLVTNGQGLGYGVKRAAQAVAMHAELATAVEGVNDNFLFHGPYIAAAGRGALRRADAALGMARRVQSATDPESALRLLDRLAILVRAMAYGFDADDDGRIGFNEEEFGLAQARYHLDTVRRYQGIPIPETPQGR